MHQLHQRPPQLRGARSITNRGITDLTSTQLDEASPRAETEVSLVIGGMTCGACAARIERRLNGLDGVEANVNYASERARVVMPRRCRSGS